MKTVLTIAQAFALFAFSSGFVYGVFALTQPVQEPEPVCVIVDLDTPLSELRGVHWCSIADLEARGVVVLEYGMNRAPVR